MFSTRTLAVAACAVVSAFGCGAAAAQLAAELPERRLIDANGVDLFSGQHGVSQASIDIGPPEARLSHVRSYSSNGGDAPETASNSVSYSTLYLLWLVESTAKVWLGGTTETFETDGASWTGSNGMGSTLVYDSATNNYLYTSRHGTVVRFPGTGGRARSILAPDGTLTEFSIKTVPTSFGQYERVRTLFNNAGYQLVFDYASSQYYWDPTQIYALNRSATYCDTVDATCPALSSALSSTMSLSSSGGLTGTATDVTGGVTRWRAERGTIARNFLKSRAPARGVIRIAPVASFRRQRRSTS